MTALEFLTLGVRIFRKGAMYSAEGPDDPALLGQLRQEVARRVVAFRACRVAKSRLALDLDTPRVSYGAFDACGDPMPRFVGGWCDICAIASSKVPPCSQ